MCDNNVFPTLIRKQDFHMRISQYEMIFPMEIHLFLSYSSISA